MEKDLDTLLKNLFRTFEESTLREGVSKLEEVESELSTAEAVRTGI